MASTKRLLKERAQLARDPIPYITFQDEDEDDDADMGGGDPNSGIFEWKFILELNPAHDDLDEAETIGRAADSPYCNAPASSAAAAAASASSSSPKKGGILSRATRSSKAANNNDTTTTATRSTSSNTTAQSAFVSFQLKFPQNYPFKPPTITVLSKSYHPNINGSTGEICDSILTGEGWGPTLNVRKICYRLRRFLCVPDPDHPLESEIAQKMVDKPEEYQSLAYKFSCDNLTKKAALVALSDTAGKRKG